MSDSNINIGSSVNDRRSSTKVDQIVGHLIDGISQGRFVPGQRLIESDLTKELGISRGPLREALQILATKELLEIIPNRGARVKNLQPDDIRQRFQLLRTLGNMVIHNISPATSISPDMRRSLPPLTDSSLSLFSKLVSFYCQIAKENNNFLLAEYISKLNLSYFSRHIIFQFNLNTKLLEIQFHNMQLALFSGNLEIAYKEHQNLYQQIFSNVGISTT